MLTDAKSSWIRESVSVLESSVHQWAEQIQEVLEQKLEGSSQQHPEPAHHYKFWCRRGKSLRFIRDQVSLMSHVSFSIGFLFLELAPMYPMLAPICTLLFCQTHHSLFLN